MINTYKILFILFFLAALFLVLGINHKSQKLKIISLAIVLCTFIYLVISIKKDDTNDYNTSIMILSSPTSSINI